jgi:hypothetical protein
VAVPIQTMHEKGTSQVWSFARVMAMSAILHQTTCAIVPLPPGNNSEAPAVDRASWGWRGAPVGGHAVCRCPSQPVS